jgi:DNA-binding beta-propeller fold protein YncE
MKKIVLLKNNKPSVLLYTNDIINTISYIQDFEGAIYTKSGCLNLNFIGLDGFNDTYIERIDPPHFIRSTYCPDTKTLYLQAAGDGNLYRFYIETHRFAPIFGRKLLSDYQTFRNTVPLIDFHFNAMAQDAIVSTIWVAVPEKHCVVEVAGNRLTRAIGNGQVGFRYSNRLDMVMMNSPCGLAWDKKNRRLFVCDTGNELIYIFNVKSNNEKTLSRTIGNFDPNSPLDDCFTKPTSISYRNNKLFIVDNLMTSIKTYDCDTKELKQIYHSKGKIMLMDNVNDNDLLIVEDES